MQESAGRRYVQAHLQPPDPNEINWSAAPAQFKLYENSERIPCSSGSADQMGNDGAAGLSREQIGQLLFAMYGLSRLSYGFAEVHNARLPSFLQRFSVPEALALKPSRALLRPVPSGGALFPCEVYLLVGQPASLPPGIYHYDAAHHALDILRPGNYSRALHSCLAHPGERLPAYTLLLSCTFWKDGFKYGAFSYRLQGLDLGAVIAQSEVIASSSGLQPVVHYQFLDQVLDELIGLDPLYESVYAVITFTAGSSLAGSEAVKASPGTQVASPCLPPVAAASQLESIERWPLPAAVHRSSLIHTPEKFRPLGSLPAIAMPASQASQELPRSAVPLDLGAGRHQRRSADGLFQFTPLAPQHLVELLARSVSGSVNDLDGQPSCLQHTLLYCMVNAVHTIPAGIYYYHPQRHSLELVRAGDLRRAFPNMFGWREQNGFHASVCFFPVGNFESGFEVYGDRWYRLQNMEAGIMLQRLYLAAAALGLSCRTTLGYQEQLVDAFFGLPENYTSLVQVMVSPAHLTHRRYEQSLVLEQS